MVPRRLGDTAGAPAARGRGTADAKVRSTRLLDFADASLVRLVAAPGRRTRRRLAHDPHAAAVPVGLQGARAGGDRRAGRGQGRQRRRAGADEADRRQPRRDARRCSSCRSRCWSPTACCACRRRSSPSCANSCSRKVTQRAVRTIALEVFRHLHALSLRFHLARQTGGLTRDVERGQRGISTLISYTLFSILPTLVEIALVSAILIARYDWTFIAITLTRARALHHRHRHHHRLAHAVPAPDERARLEGQHARDRQPAQLRDGQVLRQRGMRGAPLRREPAALGEGGGEEPDVAVAAQHRAERDHRDRGDADHVARDRRRRRAAR